MMTHTKGPWVLDDKEDHAGHWHIGAGGKGLAYVYGGDWQAKEREANARLIAAAPELLEVLTARLDDGLHGKIGILVEHGGDTEILKLGKAALAKYKAA